jgi:hypothetical protein
MSRGWGDSGGECGWATTTMLPMPAPAENDKPWWSYEVGLIHFVGMSTEHDYTVGSEQYLWLEADLAAVDRTGTTFITFEWSTSVQLPYTLYFGYFNACSHTLDYLQRT